MVNNELEQVVISGAALITGLGASRAETWRGVVAGKRAFGKLSTIESEVPGGAEGAEAAALEGEDEAETIPREARYLRRAIRDALADAGFGERLGYEPSRCACVLGTTLHGMRSAGRFLRTGSFRMPRNISRWQHAATCARRLADRRRGGDQLLGLFIEPRERCAGGDDAAEQASGSGNSRGI